VQAPPGLLAGPAGWRGWWSGVRGSLSCCVPDGCDQEFQVLVVEAGDGVVQGDGVPAAMLAAS
jgi:hypothetical protein